ncbi:MAG: hypothetical protein GY772_03500 [bacterium]|nr:hypothetical protein [Deltaproteobacteria bacterium]MCP4239606.1 hypothetical protein [bacterium]MDP6075307.1 hypothetical protein [Myxococcota bacterium]MDP7300279.1 hypothetical protein [Myxococcota bacterium]HJO24660.1 hypothetical protein [Myxococcota bacterium]
MAWIAGVILLVLVAGAMRANNASVYQLHWGFDAHWNWEYVEHLTRTWELPAPHDGWSFAQPPLFFYTAAALARTMDGASKRDVTIAIRLMSSAIGLLGIAAAVFCVARAAPRDRRRWFIASGLLLFLPVHVYMSAMLSQEILVSALVACAAVGVALQLGNQLSLRRVQRRAAGLGFIAGLAVLTKLSGVLLIAAACTTWIIDGLRRGEWRRGLTCAAVFGGVATLVGAGYYVRNLVQFGYIYPHDLPVHARIHTMPPGERSLGDYLRVPLATFTDPQVLNRDLVTSVWGTTYTTLWFDGHRIVLPRKDPAITRLGTAMLLLALIPSAAFAVGLWRGLRRAVAEPGGVDTLFLLLVALTLAGYAFFTWRNPWYATVKGSYLLGMLVPFGYYTSEVLADWTRGMGLRQVFVWAALSALFTLCVVVFTLELVFSKTDSGPGFDWKKHYPGYSTERHRPAGAALGR